MSGRYWGMSAGNDDAPPDPDETAASARGRFAASARLSVRQRREDAERRHAWADDAHRFAEEAAARLRRLIDERRGPASEQDERGSSPPT